MRRYIPTILSGLRGRLVVGFLLVVAIALALVFATLPRLLDDYFLEQAKQELRRRTDVAGLFVLNEIVDYQFGTGAARPILEGTDHLSVPPALRAALDPGEDPFLQRLADNVALADVTITIAASPDRLEPIYQASAPLSQARAAEFEDEGQRRETLSQVGNPYEIEDRFWSQSPGGAPSRVVTVTVSNPYTARQQTLETIVSVLGVAAVIAMLAAVIASILIADRLSNPIRRLTSAARELSEGKLDTRVPPPGDSREMGELTMAFNSMAERVQEAIEYIRRDRDRSRDFLADVSHELRTPIAAMRTFNELMSDGHVDEATRREFLEQTRQQIERLDWLAQNLLELSKLESGLVSLDLRPDDLRAVVESAVQQAQPSADRKGVRIVASMPRKPIRQRHDPQRMGQVLGNLIGNAIKFTPTGGEVRVSLQPTGDGAVVEVADTGVGIDPRELPLVFDRFYRGAQANRSRAAGSGLGLSIVRSVVEMHNGRVTISSTPGEGTQVTVTLPRDVSVSSSVAVPA
jgi:signal transduction histidine kinase